MALSGEKPHTDEREVPPGEKPHTNGHGVPPGEKPHTNEHGVPPKEKPHPYEHEVPPSLEYRLQAVWFVVPPSGGTGSAREDRLKAGLRTRETTG